jgi:hypothetical protein
MMFTNWFDCVAKRIVAAGQHRNLPRNRRRNRQTISSEPSVALVLEPRQLLCGCMEMGSPPVFDASGYSFSVLEDASNVGAVIATDPDDDISDFSLSGQDAGSFSIDSSGNITAYMLDFESQVTHYFDVTVTDMMGNYATTSVSVVVGDVDEDPVFDAAGYSFSVLEDASIVGAVSATDPQNDISDFSLSGQDAGNFSIDSSGNITAYMLDFESQVTHYFDVTVTDMMGHSATVSVSVVVGDVAEDPVFGAGPFEFTISEMAHNDVVVGALGLTDPQDDLCSVTVYEFDPDNGGSAADPTTWTQTDTFRVDLLAGGQSNLVVDNEWNLDFEALVPNGTANPPPAELHLVLEAMDAMGNTGITEVTVTLTDEVEWGGMGVFVVSWEVLGTGRHHSEILIIPEDQATFEDNPDFGNTAWVDRQEVHYTTVGAGPSTSVVVVGGIPITNTVLNSEVNRSAIDEDGWTQRGTVETTGVQNELIALIFSLDSNYADDVGYLAVPIALLPDRFNSNSYAHGLLNALQASDSDISVNVGLGGANFPGWERPLPLIHFGVEEDENEEMP